MTKFEYDHLSVSERVANGAALLDANKPDWWKVVDLDTLDQFSNYKCVVGQNYGRYAVGCDALGRPNFNDDLDAFKNWSHYHAYDGNVEASTREWKRVINERFDAETRATVAAEPEIEPVEINIYHLADAKRIIKDALDNADARVPDLTESGVLLSIIEALGIRPLIKA